MSNVEGYVSADTITGDIEVSSPVTGEVACRNCGHVDSGSFCPECGQKKTSGFVSLKEFLFDFVDDLFSYDSKLVRSLVPLVTKPGFLTNEYLARRRARYLLPSRLYILLSLVFFFFITRFDPFSVQDYPEVVDDPDTRQALAASGLTEAQFFAEIDDDANDAYSAAVALGVIPFFALGMKLMYITRRRFLTEHLIFTFHFCSFVLIALLPSIFFSGSDWVALLLIPPLVYLLFALRSVYHQSWFMTSIKGSVLYLYFVGLLVLAQELTLYWFIL